MEEWEIRKEGFECPRCSWNAYEVLKTHAFCWNCNFSQELEVAEDSTPELALKRIEKELRKLTPLEVAYAS